MKVTGNWLKDFMDIQIAPEALAEKLTMAGLEVKSLEERDGDFVFEIEITSNRPDWLSVIGVAREIAALTGKKLTGSPVNRLTGFNRPTGKLANRLTIHIEEKNDCPLYTAKIIRDVKIGPSPDWMRKRLEFIGCRSINNVVDITNYCLFTYGHPLHAFDLDKLFNQLAGCPVVPLTICVRKAQKGEEIITIDSVKRVLDENILVIASGNDVKNSEPVNRRTGKPIAIAGIMGGKDTEVDNATKNILLESAVFNPLVIRKGRQVLAAQTDSSYRFERGSVPEIAQTASEAAANLILKECGGVYTEYKTAGIVKTANKSVDLRPASVSDLLGIPIPEPKIEKILCGLGFSVKTGKGKKISVGVPPYRRDINSEVDLIEEVARVFGFDQIPVSRPCIYPAVSSDTKKELVPAIKSALVGLGLYEVITYNLIDRAMLKGMEERYPDPIEILNPLSKEQELLRPTIIPSLIKCVSHNLNQRQQEVSLFEIAELFSSDEKGIVKEQKVLGIALCGTRSLLLGQGCVKDELGVLHLKGIAGALFNVLGIKNWSLSAAPDASGEIVVSAGGKKLGRFCIVQESILNAFDIKNNKVFAAELDLDVILSLADLTKKFQGLPVYPGISRDISLVVKEEVKSQEILALIKEQGGALLKEVKIVDYYKGKQILPGFRGMTISCFYRADERTLTEAEISPLQTAICEVLGVKLGVKIR